MLGRVMCSARRGFHGDDAAFFLRISGVEWPGGCFVYTEKGHFCESMFVHLRHSSKLDCNAITPSSELPSAHVF